MSTTQTAIIVIRLIKEAAVYDHQTPISFSMQSNE